MSSEASKPECPTCHSRVVVTRTEHEQHTIVGTERWSEVTYSPAIPAALIEACEAALKVHMAALEMNREEGFEVFEEAAMPEAFAAAILAAMSGWRLVPADTLPPMTRAELTGRIEEALHNLPHAPFDGYGYGYRGQSGRNLAAAIAAAMFPPPEGGT